MPECATTIERTVTVIVEHQWGRQYDRLLESGNNEVRQRRSRRRFPYDQRAPRRETPLLGKRLTASIQNWSVGGEGRIRTYGPVAGQQP
jgi:hypothetical protein